MLWNQKQTAQALGCSTSTVKKFTKDGRLASVKVGDLRRYRPDDVRSFIESLRIPVSA